ncbi:MAG: LPS assembly lipoprotein LptE [Paracoccus sp. (in: a-proteobacteria)]|uniref:LPS assembly lipoprotein LptE n=1 Tax=Paracoccus sp. TaxID=267 RepID=UPI0026DFC5B7|nr:LPS assembly lipoprotein LptE [Paracoccus sp. (in: a-proteobacteria)]MDO5621488.1 LPS assembly lipoprotein LptE [Paracoccus sp. (in: a-proteobacteria)]
MSLRDLMLNRRVALAGLLALAGCGFTPVYGPGGVGNALFGQIETRAPQTAEDFAFDRRITERLGTVTTPRFALNYDLRIASVGQAITADEVTTRYALNGTAAFALRDPAGATVAQGEVSSFTSYSATGTPVATTAAERDARERLARMLADQVVTQLLASAAR